MIEQNTYDPTITGNLKPDRFFVVLEVWRQFEIRDIITFNYPTIDRLTLANCSGFSRL